jgi:hypothetical protein
MNTQMTNGKEVKYSNQLHRERMNTVTNQLSKEDKTHILSSFEKLIQIFEPNSQIRVEFDDETQRGFDYFEFLFDKNLGDRGIGFCCMRFCDFISSLSYRMNDSINPNLD